MKRVTLQYFCFLFFLKHIVLNKNKLDTVKWKDYAKSIVKKSSNLHSDKSNYFKEFFKIDYELCGLISNGMDIYF